MQNHFYNNRNYFWNIFFISLLVALAFSLFNWIVPVYKSLSSENYTFGALTWQSGTNADAPFYHTFINDMIHNRKIIATNPLTFEHQDMVGAHVTYSYSLFLATIGGWFSGKIEHAYFFNYFFFPAINFILMYLLAYRLSKNHWFAIFISVFTLTNVKQFTHLPHLLIANIPFILICILIFELLSKEKFSFCKSSLLIFLLGFSSMNSAPHFVVSYGIVGMSFLIGFKNPVINKNLFIIIFISIMFSCPGIWITFHALKWWKIEGVNLLTPINNIGSIDFRYLLRPNGFHFVIVLLVFNLFTFKNKKIIQLYISSSLISVFLLAIYQGTYAVNQAFMKCALPLLIISTGCGIFNVINNQYKDDKKLSNIYPFLLAFIILVTLEPLIVINDLGYLRMIGSALVGYFLIYLITNLFLKFLFGNSSLKKGSFQKAFIIGSVLFLGSYAAKDYYSLVFYREPIYKNDLDLRYIKPLGDWAHHHLTGKDVIVSLNPYLLTFLPIYTPAKVYIPQALLSPIFSEERFQRFYEAAALYGLSIESFENLINGVVQSQIDCSLRQEHKNVSMSLLNQILYYTKHNDNPMNSDEVNTHLRNYQKVISENKMPNYKVNYVVISDYELKYLGESSKIYEIINTQSPLYKNERFSIYKF